MLSFSSMLLFMNLDLANSSAAVSVVVSSYCILLPMIKES